MASYRISRTAVVLGKPTAVTAAVERLRHPAAGTSLVSQMKALTNGNAISMSGTRGLLNAQSTISASQFKDLSGFSLAMSAHDRLNLDLRLNSDTVAGARHLLETMQKNATAAGSRVGISPKLEGTSVSVAATVPREELLQAFDKAIASPMGQRLVAMASVQAGDKVVVQGLPGGSKEIETTGQLRQSPIDENAPFDKIVIQGMPGGPRLFNHHTEKASQHIQKCARKAST